ncbi:MAG: hypothetical protein RMJ53_10870, partial [Chitinophagales bacterium]|nr:hypothetical protein [Chitinophagales bacterium]
MYKLLHRKLLDWFFDAYSFKNEFESKRAESLLYITITVGIFFICMGIVQRTLDMENIIIVGTAIGLVGIGITLLLIKFGKLYYAGDTLVLVCLIVICVADLYDDWKSSLKQNQYKIYVSLVSLLGT